MTQIRKINYWNDLQSELSELLVGTRVIHTDFTHGELVLDNGTRLSFDLDNSDCCSYIDLTGLATTDHIITAVFVEDDEDSDGYSEGEYQAWIRVLTDAGDAVKIASAHGDASNGYYLHGFALGVTVLVGDSDG
jgi:hypothetical protein